MSGYLEVKICTKININLTPWKAWKKQWCILRPSPLNDGGIFIVFHTSAGLASNSQIEIPKHSIIYRTDSKTKCYSFGIFPSADSRKPILLLAGQSESDAQLWIGRIRTMLHGNYKTEKGSMHANSFTVSIIDNIFSNSCGLKGVYGNLIITKDGFQILDPHNSTCRALVKWDHISDIALPNTEKHVDKNRICSITTNREFEFGHGQIVIFCHIGVALENALKSKCCNSPEVIMRKINGRISRSEGTLFKMAEDDLDRYVDDEQRDSGLSSCDYHPVSTDDDRSLRISMDDEGLVLKAKKASTLISAGLILSSQRLQNKMITQSLEHFNDNNDVLSPLHNFTKTSSLNRRCSGTSLSSGIYEEISEYPTKSSTLMSPSRRQKNKQLLQDNTYEVLKGGYFQNSPRRNAPPPLPPRIKNHGSRLDSTSDSGVEEESSCSTPHGSEDGKWTSLHGSLPRLTAKDFDGEKSSSGGKTVKNHDRFHCAFGVFRKRIKSESQVNRHRDCKMPDEDYSASCSGNDVSTRKRLFEFNVTPIKSSNKVKNSKITRALKKLGVGNNSSSLKNAAKSCETLDCKDEIEHSTNNKVITNRCSKSEENLDYRINLMNGIRDESFETKKSHLNLSADWCSEISDDNVKDLSIICTEETIKHSYPKDILELLLKGKIEEMKLRQRANDEEYMLMSPCRLLNDSSQIKTCFEPTAQKVVSVDKPHCSSISLEDNYVVMKSA